MPAWAVAGLALALLAWPRRADPVIRRARRLQPRGRPAPRGPLPVAVLVVGAVVTVVALVSTPVVAALAGGGAAATVRAWRRRAADRDTEARERALAEALGVLAAELRAGRPLPEATGTAVASCPHPAVAAELGPVLRTGSVGQRRAPGQDRDARAPTTAGALDRLAAAVTVSARTGCSLAAVVGAAEDDLRARLRTRAELRAAVSGPRASGVVLAGLPLLGLLMGTGVGADPWRVLTTTPVGTALLVGGVGLEVLGLAWSGRLVRRAAAR